MLVNFLISPSPKTHLSSAQTSPSTFVYYRATSLCQWAFSFSRAGLGAHLVLSSYSTMSPCQILDPIVFSALPCFACRQSLPVALLYSGYSCVPGASQHGCRVPARPWLRPCPAVYNPRAWSLCLSLPQLLSHFLASVCSWSHMLSSFLLVCSVRGGWAT